MYFYFNALMHEWCLNKGHEKKNCIYILKESLLNMYIKYRCRQNAYYTFTTENNVLLYLYNLPYLIFTGTVYTRYILISFVVHIPL